jgi:uncharacterized cupredoxin-like copper-binding protein
MEIMKGLALIVPIATAALAASAARAEHAAAPYVLAHAGAFSAGEPGDPKKPARVVRVVMREGDGKMMFVPNRLEIRRGEQIRFVLTNLGALEHEFVLATKEENRKHAEEMRKNPDMEHDDPNAARVKAGQSGAIVWRFTKSGTFEFGCLIPGHYEAGMFGVIVVK